MTVNEQCSSLHVPHRGTVSTDITVRSRILQLHAGPVMSLLSEMVVTAKKSERL